MYVMNFSDGYRENFTEHAFKSFGMHNDMIVEIFSSETA